MKKLAEIKKIPRLKKRAVDAHKGDFGKVAIIAGSYGLAGASILCARACIRSGAGLVYLFCPDSIYQVVAPVLECIVVQPLPSTSAGTISEKAIPILDKWLARVDVVAAGPGLGENPETDNVVKWLVSKSKVPTILDADALNAIARHPEFLTGNLANVVVTPHEGEMARLCRSDSETIRKNRKKSAVEYSASKGCTTVLKGHRTVVTDGIRFYINKTGNPGMATGGSGDVLTGVIAALAFQTGNVFDASVLGTFVHGLAGDIAARKLGETCLTASDIISYLPPAFRSSEVSFA